MPTSKNFKDFVLKALSRALQNTQYHFSVRKMFGEYCIYVSDDSTIAPKPIFLLYDETLFVKEHKILQSLLESAPKDFPCPGAKEAYILDIFSTNFTRSCTYSCSNFTDSKV